MLLAECVSAYQRENKLSVRQLAKKVGCNHSTLWRFLNGENTDGKTITRLLSWSLHNDNNHHDSVRKS